MVLYRDHVRDVFGLEDPIVLAVVNDGPEGVFNPASLGLVDEFTQAFAKLSNVDLDRVLKPVPSSATSMEMTMTTQTEANSALQNPSRWQKFQNWLAVLTELSDFDPQAHANATIRHLRGEVAQLGIRVKELEVSNSILAK